MIGQSCLGQTRLKICQNVCQILSVVDLIFVDSSHRNGKIQFLVWSHLGISRAERLSAGLSNVGFPQLVPGRYGNQSSTYLVHGRCLLWQQGMYLFGWQLAPVMAMVQVLIWLMVGACTGNQMSTSLVVGRHQLWQPGEYSFGRWW